MTNKFFARFLASVLMLVPVVTVSAGVVEIPANSAIANASIRANETGGDALDMAKETGLQILQIAKVIFSGLAVAYLVYLGASIVIGMGEDKDLKTAKNQLLYTVLAFLFINIPGQIYALFGGKDTTNIGSTGAGTFTGDFSSANQNVFISYANWERTITNNIIPFLEVVLVGVAIFFFTLSGLKMIGSRGEEEFKKKAKGNIFYGVMALVFVGLIETWTRVVYRGDIAGGQDLFAKLANLALFIAGPTVIFYLILGAYYYITSAGDEGRAKKGKSIFVNTFIATILLLATYTFLNDLRALTFS